MQSAGSGFGLKSAAPVKTPSSLHDSLAVHWARSSQWLDLSVLQRLETGPLDSL